MNGSSGRRALRRYQESWVTSQEFGVWSTYRICSNSPMSFRISRSVNFGISARRCDPGNIRGLSEGQSPGLRVLTMTRERLMMRTRTVSIKVMAIHL